MQDFSTKESRHEFKVDGNLYWIPTVTVGDLEAIAALADIPEGPLQIAAFREVMASRAQPQKRNLIQWARRVPSGRNAIGMLGIKNLTTLFSEWSTMSGVMQPGE